MIVVFKKGDNIEKSSLMYLYEEIYTDYIDATKNMKRNHDEPILNTFYHGQATALHLALFRMEYYIKG